MPIEIDRERDSRRSGGHGVHRRIQHRTEKEHDASGYPVNVGHVMPDAALFTDQEPPSPRHQRMHDRVSEADAEAALVNQARSGDRDAFSNLISGHCKTLYRLALRITRNHEDAEDAVQDAVLKAHSNLSKFQGRARFSTWITRIAINEALMKRRKNRRMKQVPLEVQSQTEGSIVCFPGLERRGDDPEALYAQLEVQEMISRAARGLRPMYQAVFFLARVSGCTNQETADELELPVATVKARLHRACTKLREKLHPMSGALPC